MTFVYFRKIKCFTFFHKFNLHSTELKRFEKLEFLKGFLCNCSENFRLNYIPAPLSQIGSMRVCGYGFYKGDIRRLKNMEYKFRRVIVKMENSAKKTRFVIDPQCLDSIRNSFRRLTREYSDTTEENALRIIDFDSVKWNSLSDSTTYPFGYKIQIH